MLTNFIGRNKQSLMISLIMGMFALSIIACTNNANYNLPVTAPTPNNINHSDNNSTAKPAIKNSADNNTIAIVTAAAAKINLRLRYFSEDIKTTYKPEKQLALFEDVHNTISPACHDMQQALNVDKEPPAIAVDMFKVCQQIDAAVAAHDLTALQHQVPAFKKDFAELTAAQSTADPAKQPIDNQ